MVEHRGVEVHRGATLPKLVAEVAHQRVHGRGHHERRARAASTTVVLPVGVEDADHLDGLAQSHAVADDDVLVGNASCERAVVRAQRLHHAHLRDRQAEGVAAVEDEAQVAGRRVPFEPPLPGAGVLVVRQPASHQHVAQLRQVGVLAHLPSSRAPQAPQAPRPGRVDDAVDDAVGGAMSRRAARGGVARRDEQAQRAHASRLAVALAPLRQVRQVRERRHRAQQLWRPDGRRRRRDSSEEHRGEVPVVRARLQLAGVLEGADE